MAREDERWAEGRGQGLGRWLAGVCVDGGEGEEKDAGGVEVEVGGVVDQGPDVGDEKLLRGFLLHVLELQLREFLHKPEDDTLLLRNQMKKKWRHDGVLDFSLTSFKVIYKKR